MTPLLIGDGNGVLSESLKEPFFGVALGLAIVVLSISPFRVRHLVESKEFHEMMMAVPSERLASLTHRPRSASFKEDLAKHAGSLCQSTKGGYGILSRRDFYWRAYQGVLLNSAFFMFLAASVPWPYRYRIAVYWLLISHGLIGADLASSVFSFVEHLCKLNIDVIINKMDGQNWDEVSRLHLELDLRLEKLFSVGCAMGLLLPLYAGTLLLAMAFTIFAIQQQDQYRSIVLFLMAAWAFASLAIKSWPLAAITDQCANSSSTSSGNSIRAKANSFLGDHMDADCHMKHLKYMQYMSSTFTGVEVLGVPITSSLICRCLIQIATNFPVLVAVLHAIWNWV